VKYLLVALLAGAAGWFYLIDGSKLDEAMVREFYEQQSVHTYERDPEALCKQLGSGVKVRVESRMGGKVNTASYGKEAACRQLSSAFKFFEDMGEKAGGTLTIEYSYDIHSLELSSNHKSATVEVSSTLKMGEEFMQIFSDSTDRVERSLRRVQLVEQDAKTHMKWTPGAIVHPEQYFQEAQ
jgi:hypothetical protein